MKDERKITRRLIVEELFMDYNEIRANMEKSYRRTNKKFMSTQLALSEKLFSVGILVLYNIRETTKCNAEIK